MSAEHERKPHVPSRGAVRIADFCREAGLDQATVEELMRSERIVGGLWRDRARTRAFGLSDDVLPSAADLAALGLSPSSDYDPESLRSFEMTDDDDPEAM